MRYAHIIGWGKYVPLKIVTNDDLARTIDTSDAWIRERTGIAQRHVVADGETCAGMCVAAAERALDVAGIGAHQLDLIIVATLTPDNVMPSTACSVQDALGAGSAAAFDLSAACSGFVYALSLAADSIRAGTHQRVLVIGAEMLSRIVDWTDRSTCVLFGDGAGAVVLEGSDQPGGVLTTAMHADGAGGELLSLRLPARQIAMNGREVYRFATRVVDRSIREVLNKAGWRAQQVDLVVPHQANLRIIESASKSLGIAADRFFVNIEHYGNTSSASIPIAICDAVEAGRLKPNHRAIFVGFGGGLTWGAVAVQWDVPRITSRAQRAANRAGAVASVLRSRTGKLLRRGAGRLFGTADPTLADQVGKLAARVKPAPQAETETPPRGDGEAKPG